MISAMDAVSAARSLLGTPYEKMDCINLIKAVIRRSPGGDPLYTDAGTNALWSSCSSSGRYRHMLSCHLGVSSVTAGNLVFKTRKSPDGTLDVHHVGLVTEDGTVIHSSGPDGKYRKVVETRLDSSWNAQGVHRLISVLQGDEGMENLYYHGNAIVTTEENDLRVRTQPVDGDVIGHVQRGMTVQVIDIAEGAGPEGWLKIRDGNLVGWASGEYLQLLDDSPQEEADEKEITTFVSDTGQHLTVLGNWHVQTEDESPD